MKRFFLAHPLLVGAVAGVLFFAATELLAAGIRFQWMERVPSSSWHLTAGFFALFGVAKGLFFGIALGRICGLAAHEWLSGERAEAKRMLRTAGWTVVGCYGVLVTFSVPGLVSFFLNISQPPDQKMQDALELIFFTFPLQVAILLIVLSRILPAKSGATTQITQNLRL